MAFFHIQSTHLASILFSGALNSLYYNIKIRQTCIKMNL